MNRLELYVSNRYIKQYEAASITLKNIILKTIYDFVNGFYKNPMEVTRGYDRVNRISSDILEMKVSGGYRLLAMYTHGQLFLLAVGDHDITKRYDQNQFKHDKRSPNYAPDTFWPQNKSSFFQPILEARTGIIDSSEVGSEWLYFLLDEQQNILNDIINVALEGLESGEACAPQIILGGPGTGKTCILLNMLEDFVGLGYSVGLSMSSDLIPYIQNSTKLNIEKYRITGDNIDDYDVVLYDDPKDVELSLDIIRRSSVTIGVLVFDPLQADKSLTDDNLDQFKNDYGAVIHILTKCYRQKENVGRTALNVCNIIAQSAPFSDKIKVVNYQLERKNINIISNNMIYMNPYGYYNKYENFDLGHIKNELNRILKAPSLLWKHWPGRDIVKCCGLPVIRRRSQRLRWRWCSLIDTDHSRAPHYGT